MNFIIFQISAIKLVFIVKNIDVISVVCYLETSVNLKLLAIHVFYNFFKEVPYY